MNSHLTEWWIRPVYPIEDLKPGPLQFINPPRLARLMEASGILIFDEKNKLYKLMKCRTNDIHPSFLKTLIRKYYEECQKLPLRSKDCWTMVEIQEKYIVR